MTQGTFIVIDGPNGTGKTRALKAAATALRSQGYDVVETREPGGTPLAEELRAMILMSSNPMDTTTQLLLFNAARRSHIQSVILPSIEAGRIVLCDRFLASSLVFQSLNSDGSQNLDDQTILHAHELFCYNLKPDLSIYLDAPTAVRLQRIAMRIDGTADRFEEFGNAFENASSEKFRKCGNMIDKDYRIIDASQSPEQVAEAVLAAIHRKIESMNFEQRAEA